MQPPRGKLGLPPGTVVYTGEERPLPVVITVARYDAGSFERYTVTAATACPEPTPGRVTWVHVDGVHRVEEVEAVARRYELHPLVIEDLPSVDQRPKVETYGADLFIVGRSLRPEGEARVAEPEQLAIVLRENLVLSFSEAPSPEVDLVLAALEAGRGRVREMGADYLVYRLLDVLIDEGVALLEVLDERVEELDELSLTRPEPRLLERIDQAKREVREIRRVLWPMRDLLGQLVRDEFPHLTPETRLYLRDVQDHVMRAVDTAESELEVLNGIESAALALASQRLNETMRTLAVAATFFLPMNLIAGIYGMNFDRLPGAHHGQGFWLALGLMLSLSTATIVFLRWRRWI